MKTILIFSLFLTTNAFASDLLFEKHVKSGFIEEELSFERDCTLSSNRHLTITRREGMNSPETHTHHVGRQRVALIRSLLRLARNAQITDGEIQCDGGDNLLYGHSRGVKFIIDEEFDCGTSKVNQSQAAERLRRLARQMCGF